METSALSINIELNKINEWLKLNRLTRRLSIGPMLFKTSKKKFQTLLLKMDNKIYQPGSNIIIVYCKHITRAQTDARTRVRTHPRERVHTYTHPHTHRRRRTAIVTGRSAGDNSWSLAIEINTGTGGPVSPRF